MKYENKQRIAQAISMLIPVSTPEVEVKRLIDLICGELDISNDHICDGDHRYCYAPNVQPRKEIYDNWISTHKP